MEMFFYAFGGFINLKTKTIMEQMDSKQIRRDGIYISIIENRHDPYNFWEKTHHIDGFGLTNDETFFDFHDNFDEKERGLAWGGLGSLLSFYSEVVSNPSEHKLRYVPYEIHFSLAYLIASYKDDYFNTELICTLFDNGQVAIQNVQKDIKYNTVYEGLGYICSFISINMIEQGLTDQILSSLLPQKKKKKGIWNILNYNY